MRGICEISESNYGRGWLTKILHILLSADSPVIYTKVSYKTKDHPKVVFR